jgi:hypothetical protein
MSELGSCETKYYHRKVANTPKDSDYEESDALGLGKAFHAVLEKNLHKTFTEQEIISSIVEFNVAPSDKDLLTTMLNKYVAFRIMSGIRVVKCELQITTSIYNGFIDYIAIQGNKWYIGDLKTAARHDESILSRLPLDPQLNLYAHFADEIDIAVPEVVGLEFAGCLYSQITKSKAGTQKGLDAGVKVYETFIPVEAMAPEVIWDLFQSAQTRAEEIHAGEVPKKNFSSCFNFFSPCQYFSQCYGSTFTDNRNKVKVTTLETLKDEELL